MSGHADQVSGHKLQSTNKSIASSNFPGPKSEASSQTMAAPSHGWHYILLYLTIHLIVGALADGHTSEEERQKARAAAARRPPVRRPRLTILNHYVVFSKPCCFSFYPLVFPGLSRLTCIISC